jgi:acyl-CoA synthetase (AMP-forming)/AMP-acid ligase II
VIFKSPFPDVSWSDTSITEATFRHAGRLADRTAIADGVSGRSYTYAQLDRAVRQFAAGLRQRGLAKGDVIAIQSANVPEYPIAFHGACTAGLVVTTLDPLSTPGEIGYQLRDSRARMLVTIPPLVERARAAAAGSNVRQVVAFGEADGAIPLSALLASGEADQVAIDPATDLAALPYSSAATGVPKGVVLTHRNLVANLFQSSAVQDFEEGDAVVAVLPFFHVSGMNAVMNAALFHGGSVVSLPHFELKSLLAATAHHRVRWLWVAPPIVVALGRSPSAGGEDLTRVIQGYNLTGTGSVTHAMPAAAAWAPSGTVGRALPNTECRVVSPDGRELGPCQDGEIWIRGPQVTRGYLNNRTATSTSIDASGFFRTGVAGHVDEDGWWFIVDQLEEHGDLRVVPAELVALLLSDPAIAETAP